MSPIDGTQTDARPNESDLNGKGLNDMGYITELRKLVGTRPLVMAGRVLSSSTINKKSYYNFGKIMVAGDSLVERLRSVRRS